MTNPIDERKPERGRAVAAFTKLAVAHKSSAIVLAMVARSGKIALALAALAGGLIWLVAPGCSSETGTAPCSLGCEPNGFCCNHAYAFDDPLPDGGPSYIPDGGHLPGVQFPACLYRDAKGAVRLPNGQLGQCADMY